MLIEQIVSMWLFFVVCCFFFGAFDGLNVVGRGAFHLEIPSAFHFADDMRDNRAFT